MARGSMARGQGGPVHGLGGIASLAARAGRDGLPPGRSKSMPTATAAMTASEPA
jgi:hypothetical protein